MQDALADYPHLEFRRCWDLRKTGLMNLARCTTIVECLSGIPIEPDTKQQLRMVSFRRGAQATTAIEGNTLTDEELQKHLDGEKLPASRMYQVKEVMNALKSMRDVWTLVVEKGHKGPVTKDLICRFNREIGADLWELYDGVPGRLRTDRRHVGRYLAPPPEHVEALLTQFCDWLRHEFGFHSGEQSLEDVIVQAIVAHIFFEWIHPFADGNGRTGRLIEFYILARGGFPDITAHILANHYNDTRTEYAAHFDKARQSRDLTNFLEYAIQGFLDGLRQTLEAVQNETIRIAWRSHVYSVFDGYTNYSKRTIFRRRRFLALSMPIHESFTLSSLVRMSDWHVKEYMGKDARALKQDLREIEKLGLITRIVTMGREDVYRTNCHLLLATQLPIRAVPLANHPSRKLRSPTKGI